MLSLELSHLIPNFYAQTKTEKVVSLFQELTSGKYHQPSNHRRFLLDYYQSIFSSLTSNEYRQVERFLFHHIPLLVDLREKRKVSYSLLVELLVNSHRSPSQLLSFFQEEILLLVQANPEKYLFLLITLAQIHGKLELDISHLDTFFIEQYLVLSRGVISARHLMDYSINVSNSNKRRILQHLISMKPFRNENIIPHFITLHRMEKFQLLI